MTSRPTFISYSTDDSAAAEQIRGGLEAAGIVCWIAPRDIVPGKEYAEQILDAIEGCAVMVLVVSETSNVSRFVRSEVERAVSKDKIVIPIRIHDVTLSRSLEFFISSAQWIDALDGVDAALPALTAALRQHLPAIPTAAEGAQRERVLNLPDPSTPFVGRSREIGEILGQLSDPACRLLTLVGQGGIGKTRLAIEVARQAYESEAMTPDGVYFAALETLSRPEQIAAAVAGALGLPVEGADPHLLVLRFVAGKRLLLVLDNFEHLLEGAEFVLELLAASPGVKVLATSRETLNLQEEWFYPVGGLDLPDLPEGSEEQMRRSAAVQLFLQNAQRARAGRDFTAELPCIVRVCRLVEGAPLALELAAHWLRTLSCSQIVEQLQQNLDLLATPVRNVPERHRSMRAVFDYSWQLTGPRERAILCQLAVFAGGFDWEAFQAVTRGTLGELSLLMESSWIQRNQSERYTLHPLVRAYLGEKLDQEYQTVANEAANAVHDRHSLHYALVTHEGVTTDLQLEMDNLVTGLRHAVERSDTAILYRYAVPWVWWPLPLGDFETLLEAAINRMRRDRAISLNTSDSDAVLHASLLLARGTVLRRAGRIQEADALEAETQSLLEGVRGRADAIYLRAQSFAHQGLLRIIQGGYAEAETVLNQAQEIGDILPGDPLYDPENAHEGGWRITGAHARGWRAEQIGAYDDASAFLRSILEQTPELPELVFWIAHARLSGIAIKQGRFDDAREHLAAAAEVLRNVPLYQQHEFAHFSAGYELLVGNASAAAAICQTVLPEVQAYGYAMVEAQTLNMLGKANLALWQSAESETAYRKARQVAEGRFFQSSVEALAGLGAVAVRQGQDQVAEERFRQVLDEAWPAGLLPEVLEAVIGMAEVRAHQGDTATARRWLEVAIAHPATVYLVKVHAQEVLKGLGEETAVDGIRDPQAALAEIVTAVVASDGDESRRSGRGDSSSLWSSD